MWLDSEIYIEVEEATRTYYTREYIKKKGKQVYVPKENIEVLIEDLLREIEHLKDEIKEKEENNEESNIDWNDR